MRHLMLTLFYVVLVLVVLALPGGCALDGVPDTLLDEGTRTKTDTLRIVEVDTMVVATPPDTVRIVWVCFRVRAHRWDCKRLS